MTDPNQQQLGNTLWSIANQLRGARPHCLFST
jgi:hypothetical protein